MNQTSLRSFIHVLSLLLITASLLSACAHSGSNSKTITAKKEPKNKLSMIDISRGLSGGSVDVFETEGALLTKPVPPSGKAFGVSSVPRSQEIITTDRNVVIYDLNTNQPIKTKLEETRTMSESELEPPIPPIGLPDLQPPVESLGELESPFDENGNLLSDEKKRK